MAQLNPHQLAESLRGGLQPLYIIHGEEDLLRVEALDHIRRFSTHHSEAIITENKATAAAFQAAVDSAAVYVNASTRFADELAMSRSGTDIARARAASRPHARRGAVFCLRRRRRATRGRTSFHADALLSNRQSVQIATQSRPPAGKTVAQCTLCWQEARAAAKKRPRRTKKAPPRHVTATAPGARLCSGSPLTGRRRP